MFVEKRYSCVCITRKMITFVYRAKFDLKKSKKTTCDVHLCQVLGLEADVIVIVDWSEANKKEISNQDCIYVPNHC